MLFRPFMIALCLLLAFGISTTAQDADESDLIAVEFTRDLLTGFHYVKLHSVDGAGNLILLQTFEGDGVEIPPSMSDVVVSPDQAWIAFTAMNRDTDEARLLIYSTREPIFESVLLPGVGRIVWSPDSRELLIAQPHTLLGSNTPTLEDILVYTLGTGEPSVLIKGDNRWLTDVRWLENDGEIIYEMRYKKATCTAPCISTSEIHRVVRATQKVTQLTDHRSLIDQTPMLDPLRFFTCWIDSPTWSAFHQRLYYSLDCRSNGNEVAHTIFIMSVDSNGKENRVEARLAEMFEDSLYYSYVLGIYPLPDEDKVYVAAAALIEDFSDDISLWDEWYVFALNTPTQTDVVISQRLLVDEPAVNTSAISPDARHLLLASEVENGKGALTLIELETGVLTHYPITEMVCEMIWVTSHTLFYHTNDTYCSDHFRTPTGFWHFDIETGIRTDITPDPKSLIWVLDPTPSPSDW